MLVLPVYALALCSVYCAVYLLAKTRCLSSRRKFSRHHLVTLGSQQFNTLVFFVHPMVVTKTVQVPSCDCGMHGNPEFSCA